MEKNKREQVLELLKEGSYTKVEIADKLGMKVGGVSTQLTYLRWMGFFIIWDADKKMSLTDEAGYNAWEAAKAPAKSKSVSKRAPEVTAASLAKTVSKQEATLAVWENKLELLTADNADEDLIAEADANIILLKIKIKRNRAKLAELPEPVIEAGEVEAGEDEAGEDEAGEDEVGEDEAGEDELL